MIFRIMNKLRLNTSEELFVPVNGSKFRTKMAGNESALHQALPGTYVGSILNEGLMCWCMLSWTYWEQYTLSTDTWVLCSALRIPVEAHWGHYCTTQTLLWDLACSGLFFSQTHHCPATFQRVKAQESMTFRETTHSFPSRGLTSVLKEGCLLFSSFPEPGKMTDI